MNFTYLYKKVWYETRMDLKVKNAPEYKKIFQEETIKFLGTSLSGLSGSEAVNRLAIFGYNEIVEKKKNPLLEFLLCYWAHAVAIGAGHRRIG